MKYCPTCQTTYEEDILRFCMKDGSPLLESTEPSFTELPSEALPDPRDNDEQGESTVIRRNVPSPTPDPEILAGPLPSGERIIIPTYPTQQTAGQQPPVAGIVPTVPMQPVYQQPPPRTNTLAIVAFTMFGTVAAITIGALLVWFLVLSRPSDSNSNSNINSNANSAFNANINSNLGLNTSVDLTTNQNNANLSNANLRTPTPSPSPTPSPTPTPRPSPTPTPGNDEPTPTPPATNAATTPRPGPTLSTRPAQPPPETANSNRP